jgi:hypothetical protein
VHKHCCSSVDWVLVLLEHEISIVKLYDLALLGGSDAGNLACTL